MYKLLSEKNPDGPQADRVEAMSKEFKQLGRKVNPFLVFPGVISINRAILHGYMSGVNSHEMDRYGFMEGVAKFGIDVPIPCITKRLALYGNTVDILEQVH